MPRILLVEDESAIAETVVYALRVEGFDADHCLTGQQAMQVAAGSAHDLAILDVGLPDMGGFALCRELRRERDLPVIFLTAHGAEMDRLLGLELGADDYVTKPFSPRELVARVRAVLRRTGAQDGVVSPPPVVHGFPGQDVVQHGIAGARARFEHDVDGKRIRYHGHALDLTRYEYGLLAALLARPGAVLSRAQLMDRVWGDALESSDRTVDTHVKTLRSKLHALVPDHDPIRTHRSLGYSLDA